VCIRVSNLRGRCAACQRADALTFRYAAFQLVPSDGWDDIGYVLQRRVIGGLGFFLRSLTYRMQRHPLEARIHFPLRIRFLTLPCSYHPDHQASGRIALDAAFFLSSKFMCAGMQKKKKKSNKFQSFSGFTRQASFRSRRFPNLSKPYQHQSFYFWNLWAPTHVFEFDEAAMQVVHLPPPPPTFSPYLPPLPPPSCRLSVAGCTCTFHYISTPSR
jgi:hypothetical protein